MKNSQGTDKHEVDIHKGDIHTKGHTFGEDIHGGTLII